MEKRPIYHRPELIAYGQLTTLTGTFVCSGSGINKSGPSADELTPFLEALTGIPVSGDIECQ